MAGTNDVILNVGAQLSSDAESKLQQSFSRIEKNMKFNTPFAAGGRNVRDFSSELDRANQRVITLGASFAVLSTSIRVFKDIITSTVAVEKALTDINSVFRLSTKNLEQFSRGLFNVARETSQSFEKTAEAAKEFSRQGLGAEEVLKRTRDAMVLTRLASLGAEEAVSTLTAAINGFQKSALDSTQIVNKLATVDAQFAVSSKDLAQGLARAGAAASDAGVSFNQLIGLITSAQQTTARGGAVIGNSLKTIFTRIERKDTIEAFEALGVAVTDTQGKVLPAIGLLQNFANVYDKLGGSVKKQAAELVGGVYQINILKALLADVSKGSSSVAERAAKTSENAADEAIKRNEALNKSLAALAQQAQTTYQQVGSKIGDLGIGNAAKGLLSGFTGSTVVQAFANAGESETNSAGEKLAAGVIKGFGSALVFGLGPAVLAVLGNIASKTAQNLQKDFAAALDLRGVGKVQAETQQQIVSLYNSGDDALKRQIMSMGTLAERAAVVEGILSRTARLQSGFQTDTSALAGAVVNLRKTPRAANGYDPFSAESSAIRAGVGGASPNARPVMIPNFAFGGGKIGPIVANTSEYMVKTPNGSAIYNPAMIQKRGLPPGSTPIAAGGYLPGGAPNKYVQNIIDAYRSSFSTGDSVRFNQADRATNYYPIVNKEIKGLAAQSGKSVEQVAYGLAALSANAQDGDARATLKSLLAGGGRTKGITEENAQKALKIFEASSRGEMERLLGGGAKTHNFAPSLLLEDNFSGFDNPNPKKRGLSFKSKTGTPAVMDSWAIYVRNGGAALSEYDSEVVSAKQKRLLFDQSKKGYGFYNKLSSEYQEAAKILGVTIPQLQGRTWGWARGQPGSLTRMSAASGYDPISMESKAIQSGVGGADKSASPVYLPNFARGGGQMGIVANTSEFIVPTPAGKAIYTKDMASKFGLPKGSTPIAAGGYIPNMAEGKNPYDLPPEWGSSDYYKNLGAGNQKETSYPFGIDPKRPYASSNAGFSGGASGEGLGQYVKTFENIGAQLPGNIKKVLDTFNANLMVAPLGKAASYGPNVPPTFLANQALGGAGVPIQHGPAAPTSEQMETMQKEKSRVLANLFANEKKDAEKQDISREKLAKAQEKADKKRAEAIDEAFNAYEAQHGYGKEGQKLAKKAVQDLGKQEIVNDMLRKAEAINMENAKEALLSISHKAQAKAAKFSGYEASPETMAAFLASRAASAGSGADYDAQLLRRPGAVKPPSPPKYTAPYLERTYPEEYFKRDFKDLRLQDLSYSSSIPMPWMQGTEAGRRSASQGARKLAYQNIVGPQGVDYNRLQGNLNASRGLAGGQTLEEQFSGTVQDLLKSGKGMNTAYNEAIAQLMKETDNRKEINRIIKRTIPLNVEFEKNLAQQNAILGFEKKASQGEITRQANLNLANQRLGSGDKFTSLTKQQQNAITEQLKGQAAQSLGFGGDIAGALKNPAARAQIYGMVNKQITEMIAMGAPSSGATPATGRSGKVGEFLKANPLVASLGTSMGLSFAGGALPSLFSEPDQRGGTRSGMAIGGATSMLTMAGAGAGIGSFGGPIGTAIGVGAGGAIGLISGALGKLTKSFEDLAKEINDANDKIRREFENASQASRITEEIVRLKSEGGSERQIFMAQKRLNTALSSVYNPKTRLGISGTKAERDAALEEIMDRQASVSIAGDAMSSVRSGLDEGTSIFGADFKDTLKARKTIGAGLSPFLSKQTPEKLNEYREQILKDPQFIKQILKDAGVSEGQIKETLPNESLSKYSTMASMIPVIGPLLGGIGATVGSKDLQSGGVYQRGVLSGINSAIQTKKAAALSDKTSNEEVLRMKGIAELSEKYRQSSEFQKITGGANQSILGVQKQIAFSAPGLTDLNKIGLESYYAKQASQLQYKTESSSQIADTQSRLLSMVKAKGGESPEAIARIKGISGTGDLQRLISDLSSPEGIKKSGLAGVGGLSDEFKKALQEAVRAQESLNKSLEEQNRATDENTSALEKDYRFKGTRAGGASEYGKNAANAEELFNRSLERRDVPDITEALNTQRRIANLNKEFQAGNISQDRYDADVSIGAMSDLLKKQGRENASLSYEPGKEERAKLQRRLNFGTIERRQLDNESSLRTARGENDEEKVRDLLLEQTTILAEKERMMGLITQNQEKITVGVATENKALKDAIETNRVLLDIAKRRGDEEESINKLKINGKNLALEEKFRSNGISEGDLRLERLRNAEKIVGQFESGSSISGKRLARAQEEGLQGNSMESLKVGFGSVFAKMKRDFADLSDLGANLGQSLSSNLSGAFGDFVTGAKSGKDAFRSFAVSVLGDASRMFASQAIQGILGSMFGGSSPAVGRANGGPIPFAMGGKVPAMLTGGEYYIGPKAAKSIGYDTLHRLNKYADGGMVRGGSGVKDDVPARLAPGSFIIKKSAVGKLGPDYLDSLVNGKVQHRFFGGLLMGAVMGGALGYATGGKKGAIAGAIIGGIGGGLAQNYSQTGSLFKADAGAGAFQFGPSAASGPTLQANVNPGVGMGSDFVRNMDPATMSAASLAQKTAMPMWQKAALGLGASALLGGVSSMLAPKDPKFTPMNATEISANRVRLETEQRGMTPPSGLFPWLSANPNGGSNQMGYVLPPTRRMYANGGMVDFESPALFENGGKVAPQSPRIFADAGKTGFQSPRVLTNSGKPAFQSPLAFVTNEKVDPRPSIAFANRENVDFQSPRLFANGGKVDFQSPRLFSNGGMATASEKMDLQSPRLFADGGIVSNAGKMNFQSPRLFANGGMVSSGGKTDFQSPRLFANGGTVSSGEEANFQSPRLFAAGGMVTSGGGMNLQPPRLFAGGGMVTGGGGVDFQAPRLFADGGMVDGGGSVEMAKPMTSSSGGGGSSNVNVKIEINNNGTSSASASSDKKDGQGGFGPDFAMKLQKQVQGIVQQELVNQSRSDGFFAQKNRFVQGR